MSADHDSSANNPQVTNGEEPRFFSLLSDADRHRIWERIMALPERKKSSEPLTEFDQHFQTIVPAKLEGYIRLGAYMVRLNLETFTSAHDRVMRVAVTKYGATHLSDGALHDLEDWIDQALLAMIDAPPPEGLVTPEQLARIQRETS